MSCVVSDRPYLRCPFGVLMSSATPVVRPVPVTYPSSNSVLPFFPGSTGQRSMNASGFGSSGFRKERYWLEGQVSYYHPFPPPGCGLFSLLSVLCAISFFFFFCYFLSLPFVTHPLSPEVRVFPHARVGKRERERARERERERDRERARQRERDRERERERER